MKYLLIYLAVGVYSALTFYRKGIIRLKRPYSFNEIKSFVSDNFVVILLWPLSILLRVVMRKPDSLQLDCYEVDEDTMKTHLTFNLDKGNTILDIRDEQMQEIITMWCLSKTKKGKENSLTIRHQDKKLEITISNAVNPSQK